MHRTETSQTGKIGRLSEIRNDLMHVLGTPLKLSNISKGSNDAKYCMKWFENYSIEKCLRIRKRKLDYNRVMSMLVSSMTTPSVKNATGNSQFSKKHPSFFIITKIITVACICSSSNTSMSQVLRNCTKRSIRKKDKMPFLPEPEVDSCGEDSGKSNGVTIP